MITLSIKTDSPFTEVEVVDQHFRTVWTGIGSADLPLPIGIYKVRLGTGADAHEELVAATAEMSHETVGVSPRKASSGKQLLSSAAPMIMFCSTSHEYHHYPSFKILNGDPIARGSGSRIFLFLRQPDESKSLVPPQGISLLTPTGREFYSLELGTTDFENRYSAFHIEVDPGTYALSVPAPDGGSVCIAVPAIRGWCTQLYLVPYMAPVQFESFVDVSQISMFMRDPSFEKHVSEDDYNTMFQEQLYWLEMARKLFARFGTVASPETLFIEEQLPELNSMLQNKFGNPMLGIFAAHLLAPQKLISQWLLSEVIGNLRGLVGDIPDVAALQLLNPESRESRDVLDAPPILKASYDLALNKQPSDMSSGNGWITDVADRQVIASPYFAWRKIARSYELDDAAIKAARAIMESRAAISVSNLAGLLNCHPVESWLLAWFFDIGAPEPFPWEFAEQMFARVVELSATAPEANPYIEPLVKESRLPWPTLITHIDRLRSRFLKITHIRKQQPSTPMPSFPAQRASLGHHIRYRQA